MKLGFAIAALSAAFCFWSPALKAAANGTARPVSQVADELKPMLKLQLWDLEGKSFSADKLRGSIVVLDLWATWCKPCIAEIPRLNDLDQAYAGKGVKVVGVTLASGTVADVKPFVTRHNMKYMILMGDDDQTYDLNIVGYPTTYLVTRDWKIFGKYVGSGPLKTEQIEYDIKRLLQTEADSSR
jgi:thiol-disulfide isomerase/thioredoxin